jgi:hypothetical protein
MTELKKTKNIKNKMRDKMANKKNTFILKTNPRVWTRGRHEHLRVYLVLW